MLTAQLGRNFQPAVVKACTAFAVEDSWVERVELYTPAFLVFDPKSFSAWYALDTGLALAGFGDAWYISYAFATTGATVKPGTDARLQPRRVCSAVPSSAKPSPTSMKSCLHACDITDPTLVTAAS